MFGPDDDLPRPAVLLFHGCGGVRGHMADYAAAAAALGVRAFVIDSFAHRGWSYAFGATFVCTGLRFWGRERAGDVLAALWGVTRRADVDPTRICLAGWSHGGWTLMDLMTMPLQRPGEAALADPDPALLGGVRSLFLAYPYGGLGALSRSHDWRRAPEVLGLVPSWDHFTGPGDVRRIYEPARRAGASVELWEMEAGTHSFDEPEPHFPMRAHPEMTAQARLRFGAFLQRTLETAQPAMQSR
ncbi:MAG TPA: prolyl oligopeptidase family serine peptidase [Longimicrobium sp.]